MAFNRANYNSLEDFFTSTMQADSLREVLPKLFEERRERLLRHSIQRQQERGITEDAEFIARQQIGNEGKITSEDIAPLTDVLKSKDINRLSAPPEDWKMGRYASVIPITSKKQLLRISLHRDEDRAYAKAPPMLLKPIASFNVGKFHIEVLPEVNTDPNAITDEHLRFLDEMAGACGYVFWDIKKENVGLLSNGIPVIIDPGAICDMRNLTSQLNLYKKALSTIPKHQHTSMTLVQYTNNRDLALGGKSTWSAWLHNYDKRRQEDASTQLIDTFIADKDGAKTYQELREAVQKFNGWALIHSKAMDIMSHEPGVSLEVAVNKAVEATTEQIRNLQSLGVVVLPETLKKPVEGFWYTSSFAFPEEEAPKVPETIVKLFEHHQQNHLRELGLEYGNIADVFKEERLKELFEKEGHASRLAGAVRKYGLDEPALGLACSEATSQIINSDPKEDTDWRGLIEQRLAKASQTPRQPG